MLNILPRDQQDRFLYWKEELMPVMDRLSLDLQVGLTGRAIQPPAWRQQEGLTRDELRTHVRAELEVPRYINDYNYNMGGVDIADQHRQAFKTQRKAMKNWYPSWYWMLDHACINAFKIGVHTPGKHWTKRQHKDFRQLLYQELFAIAWKAEVNKQTIMLGTKRLDPTIYYSYIKLYEKRRAYT
ncbi:hypothetical protein OEA41_010442 [Lepraria neglecta]|uniref:PiggyBac transposable element-derived protein domain-containing protein n=1 Tax=Lepraria neglecta TaxID=209136 RepID=A0AAD9YWL8_9LECA|nr:hypothetical protein OEA41_010442 [Lepraria neglecta]